MLPKIDEREAHDLTAGRNIAQEYIGLDLDTECGLWRWYRGIHNISWRIIIKGKR
jgi:hypothetical protein